MNTRRLFILLIPLLIITLACQATTNLGLLRPSVTPTDTTIPSATPLPPSPTVTFTPTFTPRPPTATPTVTLTPTHTASPTVTPTFTSTATATSIPTPSELQFEVFEQLWQIVNEEYLYRDFNGLDWNKVHQEYLQRIQTGLTNEDFYVAMHEMINRLGDNHSTFLSVQEAIDQDAEFAGDYNYVGIGVLVEPVVERKLVSILVVFSGSPAEEVGLKIHDNILSVDGQPIVDETGFHRNLLRGPEGTTITISVQTPGQDPRQLQVTRRKVNSEMPVPYQVLISPGGKRIGYLLLVTFNDRDIPDKVGEALRQMTAKAPLDGLIIDNRPNIGGANTVLVGVLSYFTNGLAGYYVNRQNKEPLKIIGQDIGGSQKLPLVVLIGPGTVSFGEIFSGILKDIQRAYLIGQTTEGNVEILYIYMLLDGSRAWIAHDTFQPLNEPKSKWEGVGVIPDLIVLSNWDQATTETDPAVKAALDHLDKKMNNAYSR